MPERLKPREAKAGDISFHTGCCGAVCVADTASCLRCLSLLTTRDSQRPDLHGPDFSYALPDCAAILQVSVLL